MDDATNLRLLAHESLGYISTQAAMMQDQGPNKPGYWGCIICHGGGSRGGAMSTIVHADDCLVARLRNALPIRREPPQIGSNKEGNADAI